MKMFLEEFISVDYKIHNSSDPERRCIYTEFVSESVYLQVRNPGSSNDSEHDLEHPSNHRGGDRGEDGSNFTHDPQQNHYYST